MVISAFVGLNLGMSYFLKPCSWRLSLSAKNTIVSSSNCLSMAPRLLSSFSMSLILIAYGCLSVSSIITKLTVAISTNCENVPNLVSSSSLVKGLLNFFSKSLPGIPVSCFFSASDFSISLRIPSGNGFSLACSGKVSNSPLMYILILPLMASIARVV